METEACKNRITRNLHKDSIRDKMLTGKLSQEEVGSDNVYRFLALLHIGKKEIDAKRFRPITIED